MITFKYYDILSSTMDEARAQALKGAQDGTVIVAAHQTAGRGRRGRVWDSAPGNLCFTFITYHTCAPEEASTLSFVAGVGVGEAVRFFLPSAQDLLYKWPNDLLLREKKVAGILIETLFIPEKQATAYLIGCGVNLVSSPLESRYPATSFQKEGFPLAYEEALQKIASSLQEALALWKDKGFAPFHKKWMDFAAGLGSSLSFEHDRESLEGIFQGINPDGALLLELPHGVVAFKIGEVVSALSPPQCVSGPAFAPNLPDVAGGGRPPFSGE